MPTRRAMGARVKAKPLMVLWRFPVAGLFKWSRWHGLRCLALRTFRYPVPDAFEWVKEVPAMPKKPSDAKAALPKTAGSSCKLLRSYPTLASYLLDTVYEDDPETARQPATLFIKFQAGECWCWVKDPSTSSQLRISAPTLSDLWPALELALSSSSAVWTPIEGFPGVNGSSRKKK